MTRPTVAIALLLTSVAVAISAVAQTSSPQPHPRARPPAFDPDEVSRVFFDNVFDRLVGDPPVESGHVATGTAPSPSPTTSDATAVATGDGAFIWSSLISAVTLEDEVKSLKLQVDQTVTTPTSFAETGHRTARQDFTLLAMLFAIIDQYDGQVRWRDAAGAARDMFARSAANLQAGGSIQAYNEAKQCRQKLDDLVRGSRLQGTAREDVTWDQIVDRTPLMRLLESRLEPDCKAWTADSGEFRTHTEALIRSAELTAAIGVVLASHGMDDAGDSEYQQFARLLQRGGAELARAARVQDESAAQQAVADISRSCTDCHGSYR